MGELEHTLTIPWLSYVFFGAGCVFFVLGFITLSHHKLMVERIVFALSAFFFGMATAIYAIENAQEELTIVKQMVEAKPALGILTLSALIFFVLGAIIVAYIVGHVSDAPQRKRTIKRAEKRASQ